MPLRGFRLTTVQLRANTKLTIPLIKSGLAAPSGCILAHSSVTRSASLPLNRGPTEEDMWPHKSLTHCLKYLVNTVDESKESLKILY